MIGGLNVFIGGSKSSIHCLAATADGNGPGCTVRITLRMVGDIEASITRCGQPQLYRCLEFQASTVSREATY